MKAYLIDPIAQSVTEVEYSGNYKDIYPLIDAELFTTVEINGTGDTIFVDDEGLLNGNPHGWFAYADYPQPLRGRGLCLGSDDEGESVAPSITIDELREKIVFLSDEQVRAMYG